MIRRFAAFWYDFVVGDDWTIAAGVVSAVAAVYGILRAGVDDWWLLPLVVVCVLASTVARANRRTRE